MKKPHFILLIITTIMAMFSAYSLAAINQVHDVDFQWYSQYYGSFSNEHRNTEGDRWSRQGYPGDMKLAVLREKDDSAAIISENPYISSIINTTDFEKEFLLYCTLGETNSPEYRIKVTDIAQRGNVVEVKLSLNSPVNEPVITEQTDRETRYYPYDIIKLNRKSLSMKGKLYFIFKNQAGMQIDEQYCLVE